MTLILIAQRLLGNNLTVDLLIGFVIYSLVD